MSAASDRILASIRDARSGGRYCRVRMPWNEWADVRGHGVVNVLEAAEAARRRAITRLARELEAVKAAVFVVEYPELPVVAVASDDAWSQLQALMDGEGV
jgi:hypothetical protein